MSGEKSYDEIIEFIASGTTPESVDAQRRVSELIELSAENRISDEDRSELEDYLQLEHIMILAKARAHQRIQFGT
jgi:hypothetical protein